MMKWQEITKEFHGFNCLVIFSEPTLPQVTRTFYGTIECPKWGFFPFLKHLTEDRIMTIPWYAHVVLDISEDLKKKVSVW